MADNNVVSLSEYRIKRAFKEVFTSYNKSHDSRFVQKWTLVLVNRDGFERRTSSKCRLPPEQITDRENYERRALDFSNGIALYAEL